MKVKVSEIAKQLCMHISTIYRKINRVTVKFRNRDEDSAYYSLIVRRELMIKTGRKLFYENDIY